ncbi:hypothetical protein E2986_11715 [Frieseomelitta varia]|uniref:Uncharacterized protein n=1 Tax=Frieseomelitta varia TaxID=561572 RepID=A0A833RWI0_9HYME|nr:hypothetical protein E2986_11715 [Frieseomelitta varia]
MKCEGETENANEVSSKKCMKVGEIVYMTNWYYLPVKKILELILIIARSSMVIELTAGKIIQMSIHTFGDFYSTYRRNNVLDMHDGVV